MDFSPGHNYCTEGREPLEYAVLMVGVLGSSIKKALSHITLQGQGWATADFPLGSAADHMSECV